MRQLTNWKLIGILFAPGLSVTAHRPAGEGHDGALRGVVQHQPEGRGKGGAGASPGRSELNVANLCRLEIRTNAM